MRAYRQSKSVLWGSLLIGGMASVFAIFLWSMRAPYLQDAGLFDKELKRARQLGIPVTERDLQPSYGKSPAKNAAPLINQALMLLSSMDNSKRLQFTKYLRDHIGSYGSLDTEALADLSESAFGAAVRLVERSLDREYADFALSYSDPNEGSAYLASELSPFALTFCSRSMRAARNRDLDGVFENLAKAYQFRKLISSEPMIRVAVHNRATVPAHLRLVSQLMALLHDDPAFMARMEKFLAEHPTDIRVSDLVGVDVVQGLAVIDDLEEAQRYMRLPKRVVPDNVDLDLVKSSYKATWLRLWNESYEGLKLPFRDSRKLLAPMTDYLRELDLSTKKSDQFVKLFAPSLLTKADAVSVQLVYKDFAEISMKIYRFKNANGRFPTREEAMKFLRVDPFSGEIYKFRSDPYSFYLASFGPDRLDSEGSSASFSDLEIGYPPN